MRFPDSRRKAPNVFFETIDRTRVITRPIEPSPPRRIIPLPLPDIRWFDPPDQNTTPITINNPVSIDVIFDNEIIIDINF
jgi:hypothetical protein